MTRTKIGAGEYRYDPAWWLPGGHAQTIWGRLARQQPALPLVREVLRAPDGDNVEIHVLHSSDRAPWVFMLHGLEGTLRSHYVGGLFEQARVRGWNAVLMMHRGCGQAENVGRRFYHSGETSDLEFAFHTLRARDTSAPWFAMGVSLGGNVLLKWLGESGSTLIGHLRAAAAVSVPFDLEAGARHISSGSRRIYDRTFLRTLRRKAMRKLERYPDLFDPRRLERARSIYEFDDAVTAPVHGFDDARDYYSRSSSLGFLAAIRIPALLLSSFDDPFLPGDVLSRVRAVAETNPALEVEFTRRGGHVGFVGGRWPWRAFYYGEWRPFRYFENILEGRAGSRYD